MRQMWYKATIQTSSKQKVGVMNCSFDNPKSSRFFPRLHDEEEWNNGLNCMGIQEG